MSQNVVSSTVLDDTSSNITYAGATWTYHTNVQSIYHLNNNTDTFTDVLGATATLEFYGNALEYWGNQGPYHGPCTLTLDGTNVGTISSHADVDDDPILLYSTNGLELGEHTLVITVAASAYPNVCEVDKFVVNVTDHITYTSGLIYTGPGSVATGSAVPSGWTNTDGNNTGNHNSNKSSPPVAAIAGAVGGVAVLALLIVAWWWFRRSRRNKAEKGTKIGNRPQVLRKDSSHIDPLLSDGAMSPSADIEKQPFRGQSPMRTDYPTQPSSYVSSSPPPSSYNPSSPAPSNVGFAPYGYGPGGPSAVGHLSTPPTSPPMSPQQTLRPTSVVSSAPTMSYYTSGPPTTEGGGFVGFVPQQPVPAIAPVWAIPTDNAAGVPYNPAQRPSPSPSPAPVVPAPAPAPVSEALAEARLPEKARYTGSMPLPTTAGASGSSAPTGEDSSKAPAPAHAPAATSTSTAATASGSAQANNNEDILSPVVPEAPPPAYQF